MIKEQLDFLIWKYFFRKKYLYISYKSRQNILIKYPKRSHYYISKIYSLNIVHLYFRNEKQFKFSRLSFTLILKISF